VAADRVDDAAAHYRALVALDAESPASMEVLASLASAFGRQREQGAEVNLIPGTAPGRAVRVSPRTVIRFCQFNTFPMYPTASGVLHVKFVSY